MHALTPRSEPAFRPAIAYEVLSNHTRRRLLESLRINGKMELMELADHLAISSLKLYNHLTILDSAGLVRVTERGKLRYAKFRPIGWARLKKQWEQNTHVQLPL